MTNKKINKIKINNKMINKMINNKINSNKTIILSKINLKNLVFL